jgi:hypothetical protein
MGEPRLKPSLLIVLDLNRPLPVARPENLPLEKPVLVIIRWRKPTSDRESSFTFPALTGCGKTRFNPWGIIGIEGRDDINVHAGCSQWPSSKAAANEEARRYIPSFA